MNTAPCNCESQTTKPGMNERPRYYARQLVTPDDMTLEQDYFRAKLRRHNRYLHGWGVVCGADVVTANKPWKVIVKTGYILSPYGDEVFIEADQCIDVRKNCTSPETPTDNECLEGQPPARPADATSYIAIRYVEKPTRLIRVPLGGCGCEDNTCEYSRFSDGYEICVIEDCPESHTKDPGGLAIEGGQPAPGCPECSEPWVVLSAFTVDETGNVVLDDCACRRQVVTFGNYWWHCGEEEGRSVSMKDNYPPSAPQSATKPKAGVRTKPATPKKPATPPAAPPVT